MFKQMLKVYVRIVSYSLRKIRSLESEDLDDDELIAIVATDCYNNIFATGGLFDVQPMTYKDAIALIDEANEPVQAYSPDNDAAG